MFASYFSFPKSEKEVAGALERIAHALREGAAGISQCFGSTHPLLVEMHLPYGNPCRLKTLDCGCLETLCTYILGTAIMFKSDGAERVDFVWEVNYRPAPRIYLIFGDRRGAVTHCVCFKAWLPPATNFTPETIAQYLPHSLTK